jgi:hypothetical protein
MYITAVENFTGSFGAQTSIVLGLLILKGIIKNCTLRFYHKRISFIFL